jgi:hypothetical protein
MWVLLLVADSSAYLAAYLGVSSINILAVEIFCVSLQVNPGMGVALSRCYFSGGRAQNRRIRRIGRAT